MKKSIVLLSAGLDSTVNFYVALKKTEILLALTFDYGQKSVKNEIKSAKKITAIAMIEHKVIKIPWLQHLGTSSLTSSHRIIPTGKKVKISSKIVSKNTAKSVWVPNRNGLFLNIAASFAESLKADYIVPGFNIEEAATFPDNSKNFLQAIDQGLLFSTANKVKTKCYTIDKTKAEIVKFGIDLNVPFSLIWPCYFSGRKWCGTCESCQRSIRAFNINSVDVTKYFMAGNS